MSFRTAFASHVVPSTTWHRYLREITTFTDRDTEGQSLRLPFSKGFRRHGCWAWCEGCQWQSPTHLCANSDWQSDPRLKILLISLPSHSTPSQKVHRSSCNCPSCCKWAKATAQILRRAAISHLQLRCRNPEPYLNILSEMVVFSNSLAFLCPFWMTSSGISASLAALKP